MELNKCKICGGDIPFIKRHGLTQYRKKTTCSMKCAGKSSVLARQGRQVKRKTLDTSWHAGVVIKYIEFSRLIDQRTKQN